MLIIKFTLVFFIKPWKHINKIEYIIKFVHIINFVAKFWTTSFFKPKLKLLQMINEKTKLKKSFVKVNLFYSYLKACWLFII